jgi:GTP-binding protein
MKFIDSAKIQVKSGDGGRGCVSFRREKYVPRGGPDGGDGGRGGHVILKASSQKDTLFRFHLNQHFKAENGRPGMGKNRHGANGSDLVIRLPQGTTVYDAESGDLLDDLTEPGQSFVVASGGRGGRGNARFATPTNRAPRHAQPGEEGVVLRLRLELKLLADAGLVGLPNVGKSTLISSMSAARPKIADYPFTTLIPNLGVVAVDDEHSFVLADIPGLIQGASQGAGLGHRFLRHIERCRILIHVLDPVGITSDNPLLEYERIRSELTAFDSVLAEKREIVVVNKMDLDQGPEAFQKVVEALPGRKVLAVSAVTRQGLDELKWAVYNYLHEHDLRPEE